MSNAIEDFVSLQSEDSPLFLDKVRTLANGVAQDFELARLYIIRIDNWFGPRWMKFAGKFTAGKGFAIGVHKSRLHVPPFVPSRVLDQRVFVGPDFEQCAAAAPLHIDCPSKFAFSRRIADIDSDAAFLWFSSKSGPQKRGALMVYLPDDFDTEGKRRKGLRDCGAFYAGFSEHKINWEPSMLRGISSSEVAQLEGVGLLQAISR